MTCGKHFYVTSRPFFQSGRNVSFIVTENPLGNFSGFLTRWPPSRDARRCCNDLLCMNHDANLSVIQHVKSVEKNVHSKYDAVLYGQCSRFEC